MIVIFFTYSYLGSYMNIFLGKKRGYLTDWVTQKWVKLTGRKIDLSSEPWLNGPAGETIIIGESFYEKLAQNEDLDIVINEKDSGLLENIDVLRNNNEIEFNPKVKDFYHHTINFGFDVWSQWSGLFRPFGWMLAKIFSLRLQQLNVPLQPMDTVHGVTSDIIQLKEKKSGRAVYRIWLRKKKASNNVIYAGCYSWCKPPGVNNNCIKVMFPLPNGNATVIMTPVVGRDGSLTLISKGEKFGDPGFYFIVNEPGKVSYVRFLKTMRETIHVYEDDNAVLRTDHTLTIWKRTFLKLHYKIFLRNP